MPLWEFMHLLAGNGPEMPSSAGVPACITAMSLRIALAQFDFDVAAIADNARRITHMIAHARDELKADMVMFPELALTGCPLLDLVQQTGVAEECQAAMQDIARTVSGIVAVVGWPQAIAGRCYNAVSVLREGSIAATCHKRMLACSPALDERPWYTADTSGNTCLIEHNGVRIGILIGQDLESPAPLAQTVAAGAALVLAPAALPFERGSHARRAALLAQRAGESGAALVSVNLVGGQDALVFEGASMLADGDGQVHAIAAALQAQWAVAEYHPQPRAFALPANPTHEADNEALVWRALTRAIADYARKNGFTRAWLGLSGGLDSALVLALAVEALGAQNVTAVRMPSRYTAGLSNDLAQAQCDALGVRLLTLPVEIPFQGFLDTLADTFQDLPVDTTEENLQSRVRGSLLMALTNKFGGLLLCTGNKSECAVGYATIYGDMCGGYAPISDVYKSEVYALANWRNAQGPSPVIPQAVIDRPPSAELRPDQRDQDSLPPYEVLDAILYRHLEQNESSAEIIAAGFDAATVARVLRLVRISEWKRHQAAPGPKISTRAFASDRRIPISRGG